MPEDIWEPLELGKNEDGSMTVPTGRVHIEIELAPHVYLALNDDEKDGKKLYTWALMCADHSSDPDAKMGEHYGGIEIDPLTAQTLLQASLARVIVVNPMATTLDPKEVETLREENHRLMERVKAKIKL